MTAAEYLGGVVQRIKARRREQGLDAIDLARLAELRAGFIEELEDGAIPLDVAELWAIAKALSCDARSLLPGSKWRVMGEVR